MKKILFVNFITMAIFNMAHPVTPLLINELSMPTYMFGVLYSTMYSQCVPGTESGTQ